MESVDVNTFTPFIKILLSLQQFSWNPSCQIYYVEVPCAEFRQHWLRIMKREVKFIYVLT